MFVQNVSANDLRHEDPAAAKTQQLRIVTEPAQARVVITEETCWTISRKNDTRVSASLLV